MQLDIHERVILRRKLIHLVGVIYALALWVFTQLYGFPNAALLLVSFVMLVMGVYVFYQLLRFIGKPLEKLGNLWRMMGSPEFLGQKEYWDVCWLGLALSIGVVVSALASDIRVAYIMTCSVILGDGVAAVVGVTLGRHKLPINRRKSFEGTFSGFTLAFVGSLLLTQSPLMSSVGVGAGMLVEALPGRFSDNATVPLATVLVLLALKVLVGQAL